MIVGLAVPGVARANTINVSLSGTDLLADANCTLREALTGGFTECAGNGEPGPVVLQLPAGTQTWVGAESTGTAMPPIVNSMIIRGAGAGSTFLKANPTADLRLFDVRATSVTIEGITFEGWTGDGPVGQGGGVIRQEQGSELIVKDCVFTNNRSSLANGKGAAISAGDGGTMPTKLTIERTKFDNNKASHAGAVWASGVSVTIVDSELSDNTAAQVGGALRIVTSLAGQVVSITGTRFFDNLVTHATEGNAGAVTLEGAGTFTVKGSAFARNHAPRVGALWAHGATVEIDTCTFDDNTATVANAGAVSSDGVLHVVDSFFTGNNAVVGGGGLYCGFGGRCLVERSRFDGNRAGVAGAIEAGPDMLTVTDSIFFDNVADLVTLKLVATDATATEGPDTGRFTLDRRVHGSAIQARNPSSKISGSCFLGATGEIVRGPVDARGNFWTATDATVRGDESVDSSNALNVAPDGCDPLRQPTQGAATMTATYTGTATAGTDYVALPATVVFDPGVSTVSLDVKAIFDAIADDGEEVSMRAVYAPTGTSAEARVRILDSAPSDLRVVTTVNRETAAVGDEVLFEVTITNDGPGPAFDVVLTDVIPGGGLGTFLDFVVPPGVSTTCVAGPPPKCTFPVLDAKQAVSITVLARAIAAGVIRNRAEVAAESDTIPANNVSEAVVTVSAAAPPDGGPLPASTSGCSCRTAGHAHRAAPVWLLPLAIVIAARRRRRCKVVLPPCWSFRRIACSHSQGSCSQRRPSWISWPRRATKRAALQGTTTSG